ncbi:small ribosomal subunit protein mS26-like [Artemia franciscana]|uniref:Small ribosomal subunit protein mS26 n=1 Tax=Artemia franciscana TaxID=6661 RepID=A0AA88HHB0_ARTSF|nr:hypothetical protein QYM36_010881 [Artemia franciscana]CAG4635786.1 EOG090X0FQ9 [Artemia franciscana]
MSALKAMSKSFELKPVNITKDFVRYARKPTWMPTAKSKLFRIPKKPVLPEDEKLEIYRLERIYKTNMKSIRMFLSSEQEKVVAASSIGSDFLNQLEEDHLKALEFNRQENERIGKLREERYARMLEEQRQKTLEAKQKFIERTDKRIKEYTKMVEELEEISKTLITADSLEKAIEEALANPVDPNFVLTKNGVKYLGITGFDSPAQVLEKDVPSGSL